jgi:hypothetical protein
VARHEAHEHPSVDFPERRATQSTSYHVMECMVCMILVPFWSPSRPESGSHAGFTSDDSCPLPPRATVSARTMNGCGGRIGADD